MAGHGGRSSAARKKGLGDEREDKTGGESTSPDTVRNGGDDGWW